MLKMHILCRRLQMELVFQTTHLVVARLRLKVGVEREVFSLRVRGCLESPCQKLVIAFAVPSAILRWCTHNLSKLKTEVSVAGTGNWKMGISCVYFGYFSRCAVLRLVASPVEKNKGDNVLESWRLGQRSSPCHCGVCWSTTCKRVNRKWLWPGGNLPMWQEIQEETKRWQALRQANIFWAIPQKSYCRAIKAVQKS